MAALLARAESRRGAAGGRVLVVQRDSPTSGWKVGAINSGRSPIGGVEPALDAIVKETAAAGRLGATHEIADLANATIVLVCVQTDKQGWGPDYGPLFAALDGLAKAFQSRRRDVGLEPPLVIVESTLAPSSMTTLVRERFANFGLLEGRDVRLGNSPNRVMPGRLVERVAASDKLVGGLARSTVESIVALYGTIVTGGTLYATNSVTAEVVKTLENAYRDVRIAFAAEVQRWCDARDIDFFALRDRVNALVSQVDGASADSSVVPSGGLLVPTVGVGGHCLPKDGILLWWRRREAGVPAVADSLILESRVINDESPAWTLALAERSFGAVEGRVVAVLGAAYRFDSEDTRNSPSLVLANQLRAAGATVRLHDTYVKRDDANLSRLKLREVFHEDLAATMRDAEVMILATGHRVYREGLETILAGAPKLVGIVDACNLLDRAAMAKRKVGYVGLGRGKREPSTALASFVVNAFRAVELGVSNEVLGLCRYLNEHHAADAFSRVEMDEVRRLAATCVTGCTLPPPGPVTLPAAHEGFMPRLVTMAPRAG